MGNSGSRDISEKRAADEALQKSEEHYRLLFDNAGEAIISHDSELILMDINRIGCELIGYSREELVGKNILELGILHPDDVEDAANMIRRHIDGEDITEAEYTLIRKDGTERLSTVTGASIHDPDGNLQSITLICRDITEERRDEESLRRTQFTVDKSTDSVLWVTPEAKIIYANEEACRRRGYTREEMLSLTLFDVNADMAADPGIWEMMRVRLRESGHLTSEFRHQTKDGEVFPVEASLSRLWFDGDEIFLVIVRDITARKEAEVALLGSRAALAKQTQELKDLLAIASHELRHPATIFKGYAHILLENADNLDSEVVRDVLMSINSASDRLARTVSQLMETSRIESGEMLLRFEEIEPHTLLNGVTAWFQGTGAEIVTTDKTHAGAMFEADREKLQAVLVNLVENAVKFSPGGSPVDLCVEAVSGGLLFSVCDKGPGISEEHAELVLERFYQVEDVEHHSIPGIGLGLHIAKTIVDEHGGWIRHRPWQGGGSVFEFFIPEHPNAELCPETEHEHVKAELSLLRELRPSDETRGDAGMDDNDTKRVLRVAVIDDDPDIVKVTMMMLKARGYEAIAAHSGSEGLEMVGRETPDAVLLDITMPGLDGIETCRRLKSDERTRDIPVIFVTAKTFEECGEEALAAGGRVFLSKPFEAMELFQSIRHVCDGSGPECSHLSTPRVKG